MKPDYKNWVPKGMVAGFAAGTVCCLGLAAACGENLIQNDALRTVLRVLKKGGTFALHDIFSRAKYGDMQAFLRKLWDLGYEKVELIDTTDGTFMTKGEAAWMGLTGSALLTGRK